MNIMAIDDDPAAHLYNRFILEDAGLPPTCIKEFVNPAQALAYLKDCVSEGNQGSCWPDVILLDINMPKINGWEFMDQFLQLPSPFKPPKIFMVSNSVNPRDKIRVEASTHIIALKEKFLTPEFFIDLAKDLNP
ncbi:MAG: response regulator [Bacteroidota bacterium]